MAKEINMLTAGSGKIKVFRIVYLISSILILGFTGYIFTDGVISAVHNSLSFKKAVNLIALLLALLFEFGIILFIIRSLRSQTLLMKHLVFKADGTPFKLGVYLTAFGGLALTAVAVIAFSSAYGYDFLKPMEKSMQLFIGDVTLIFGANLLFTVIYFFVFRHDSGIFEMI